MGSEEKDLEKADEDEVLDGKVAGECSWLSCMTEEGAARARRRRLCAMSRFARNLRCLVTALLTARLSCSSPHLLC